MTIGLLFCLMSHPHQPNNSGNWSMNPGAQTRQPVHSISTTNLLTLATSTNILLALLQIQIIILTVLSPTSMSRQSILRLLANFGYYMFLTSNLFLTKLKKQPLVLMKFLTGSFETALSKSLRSLHTYSTYHWELANLLPIGNKPS